MKTLLKKLSLLLVVFMLSAVAVSAKQFTVIILDEITNDYGRGDVRIVTYEGGDVTTYVDGYKFIDVPGETFSFAVLDPEEGFVSSYCDMFDDYIIFYISPKE